MHAWPRKGKMVLAWGAVGFCMALPILLATQSTLLAWRDPIYIAAGLAGIVGMALLVLQPLLAIGGLPPLSVLQGRRAHRWIGFLLVLSVIGHVLGLWITSPPDVLDALLFRSPTPFAVWGVIAMWALFATALLALIRRRLRPRTWRLCHGLLAAVIVGGTIIHAVRIEGTMEPFSKIGLSFVLVVVTGLALSRLKIRWSR